MKRKAAVVWKGGIKEGQGTITTDSRVLSNTQYSFSTRFAEGIGTNPEELIAAAHAACFSMALSGQLVHAGMTPERILTSGTATLEKVGEQWTVTGIELETIAYIPGADQASFEKAAQEAKAGCPISRLLNAPITLNARLESQSYFDEKRAG